MTPKLINGWRRDLEDYAWLRDNELKTFAAPDVDISAIPESAGVQKWLKVEDQQRLGSCVGHGRTSCAEIGYYRDTKGQVVQLNRMFAYLSTQRIDGINGDNGATISGACKASQQYGECLEAEWPYTGQYPSGGWNAVPKVLWDHAAAIKLQSFKKLGSYDDVLSWLVHGVGGAIIGIGWNNSCEPDAQGRIKGYYSGGGGHCLCLADWTKKIMVAGQPAIVMANSWGTGWGDGGFAYVDPMVVDRWCRDDEVYGFSDMAGDSVKPRPWDWINERFLA